MYSVKLECFGWGVMLLLCPFIPLSSSFLFVFGDDRVTYHTGANDNPGVDGEA